jgi:hypothetical protein
VKEVGEGLDAVDEPGAGAGEGGGGVYREEPARAEDVLTALDPLHPRGFLCTPIVPTSGG